VYLWGNVVEHKRGWRAQFAYPKSLVLTKMNDAQSSLIAVTAYGADVYLRRGGRDVLLWKKSSGYTKDGLEALQRTRIFTDFPLELDIVSAVVAGLGKKQISCQLKIAEDTVKHYMSVISEKLEHKIARWS
jgi:hypothetical protein